MITLHARVAIIGTEKTGTVVKISKALPPVYTVRIDGQNYYQHFRGEQLTDGNDELADALDGAPKLSIQTVASPERESILSDAYLDGVASRGNPTTSTLCFIAQNKADYSNYISQMNSMWSKLPSNADAKMRNMLRSRKDGNFRGAFGNVVAHEVLTRYFERVEYDPEIDGRTPDFRASLKDSSYIFEAFCLGKDQNEHLLNKKKILITNELKPHSHPSRYIMGSNSPIPNARGTFEGLGPKVLDYISQLDLNGRDKFEVHTVEHNGARIFFRIGEHTGKFPLLFGWNDDGGYGNPQIELLNSSLKEKLNKYKYLFSAICILDSTIWGPVYTLLETMLGKFVFRVPIRPGNVASSIDETTLEHDQTGFWGTKNPDFKGNMNVQSVLFISCGWKWDEGHKLVATLHYVENPYNKPLVGPIFQNIPNLLDPNYKGDRLKMPGLQIEL